LLALNIQLFSVIDLAIGTLCLVRVDRGCVL
jgi:hypothetical protein